MYPIKGGFASEDPIPDGINGYIYCDNNPIAFTAPFALKKIVISGSEYEPGRYKYNFIEPSIKQLTEFKTYAMGEEVTWIISKVGYSKSDINKFKEVAEYFDVNLVLINTAEELYNYINSKNIHNINFSNLRQDDLISEISFFSHGVVDTVALGYNQEKEVAENLKIKSDRMEEVIDKRSFHHEIKTYFYSCNTGTSRGNKKSFAESWVGITGGSAKAVVGGTTNYKKMNLGENFGDKLARRRAGFNPYGSRHYPEASKGVAWKIFF